MPSRIDDEQDPTVSAYLALLAQDMAAHPERLAALTEKELPGCADLPTVSTLATTTSSRTTSCCDQ